MWPLLLLLWPAAEIVVIVLVAQAIGVGYTVLLLIAAWPLGIWALRSRGRVAWQRLSAAIRSGRHPGREVLDGALVLSGGALLIVPGFITDALGVLLLAPTRALPRRLLAARLDSRFVLWASGAERGRRAPDVDSTATDVEPPGLSA
jgi:UPF0716 protein FxsA